MSHDLEYCDLCGNCHHCFGCVGLKNKSFCVLNKQYDEESYWAKIDEIKTQMLKAGEYGEAFPPELATVPYNLSAATSYKGYDDVGAAKQYGYSVREIPEILQAVGGKLMEVIDVPKDIKDVPDNILDKIIFDRVFQKHFRYIPAELSFCRKHNLPLPLEHPMARLAEKRKRFGAIAFEFYPRNCDKCGKTMQSVYPATDPRTVYCEACYLKEVV